MTSPQVGPWAARCTMCEQPRRPIAFLRPRYGKPEKVRGWPYRVCRTCDAPVETSANTNK